LAFSAFLFLGGSKLVAQGFNDVRLETALPYLALYFLFSLPLSSIDSALLSHNKTITLAVFDVFSRTLLFLCTITAVYFRPDPRSALFGLVVGSFINFIVGTILMYRANNRGPFFPSRKSLRTHFALGAPLLLATSFGVLQSSLDKWIVAIFDTPEHFAAFSIGATQIPFIGYFTGSISQVLLADSARYFSEIRQNEVAVLMWRAALSSGMILLPVMCYFWATADIIIPWLFSDQYVDSVAPFMLYLLLIPARLINYSSVEIASGKTFVVPIVFGMNAVLVALLTILLYPKSGYLSAIYANLIVTYFFSIPAHFWIMTNLLKLPLLSTLPGNDFIKLLMVICISIPVLLLKPWLPFSDHIKIIVMGGMYFIFIVFLVIVLRINIPVLKVLGDRVLQKIKSVE
jgi:O-antigen/teichoic acid export membrane protein